MIDLLYFVQTVPQPKCLCGDHWKELHPETKAVMVTAAEHRQALLIYNAPIRCEACME